jgi:hypothetical protein
VGVFGLGEVLVVVEELVFEEFIFLLIEEEDIFETVDLLLVLLLQALLPVVHEICNPIAPIHVLVLHGIDPPLQLLLPVLLILNLSQQLLVPDLYRLKPPIVPQTVLLESPEPLLLGLEPLLQLMDLLLEGLCMTAHGLALSLSG